MIPMIDLLMVTISFLLITAVWAHSQRLVADAQVPGSPTTPPCEGAECKEEAKLHVETADPSKFVLVWRRGSIVMSTTEVTREPRRGPGGTFTALSAKIADEWRASGLHREASDRHFDRAVVHAADDMAYSDLVAVIDAASAPKRAVASGSQLVQASAFDVTLAMQ